MNLKDRHLLTLMDYTKEEIIYLLDLAKRHWISCYISQKTKQACSTL